MSPESVALIRLAILLGMDIYKVYEISKELSGKSIEEIKAFAAEETKELDKAIENM